MKQTMKIATMLLIISFMFFACDEEDYIIDLRENVIAAPKFNLMAGTYNEDISIILSTDIEDATIYYTIDGSIPTTSSSVYEDTISIKSDGTELYIKTFVADNQALGSETITSYYKIDYSYKPNVYNKQLTLTDYQDEIIGTWIGKRTTPWTEDISVKISFYDDGMYYPKSLTPEHSVFYYGTDHEENSFEITTLNSDGSAMGTIGRFNDSKILDLKYIKFSEDLSVLNFEFWNEGHGPLKYSLTRIK